MSQPNFDLFGRLCYHHFLKNEMFFHDELSTEICPLAIRAGLMVEEKFSADKHRDLHLEGDFSEGDTIFVWSGPTADEALNAFVHPINSHFLLTIHGDVEPELSPDLGNTDSICILAEAHRKSDPEKKDGLYGVIVNWHEKRLNVEAFSGGDLDGSEVPE